MRRLFIVLLGLGAVLGFGLGFARTCGAFGHGYGPHARGPHALEQRAADACVRAAERLLDERAGRAAQVPAP
jgi:hypothetical protein